MMHEYDKRAESYKQDTHAIICMSGAYINDDAEGMLKDSIPA